MNEKSTTEMTDEEAELIDTWIYVLLASNENEPIRGRIRFIKEYFLMAIEDLPEVFSAAQFYPYHFGPYSTRLGVRMNALKKDKKIIAVYKSKDWQYSLTPKELDTAREIMKRVDEKLLQKISNIKSRNKGLSLKVLLRDIYQFYPEYASRSIIASDVLFEKVDPKDLIIVDDSDLVAKDSNIENVKLTKKEAEKLKELINS